MTDEDCPQCGSWHRAGQSCPAQEDLFSKPRRAPLQETKCNGCGAPIAFVQTADGKNIPLDTRAPVYEVDDEFDGPMAVRVTGHYVSHFSTCPEANRFSKGARTTLKSK